MLEKELILLDLLRDALWATSGALWELTIYGFDLMV